MQVTSVPLALTPPRVALPSTSLIVCSRNRPRLLAATIDSILHGEELPTELIIVDQSDAPYARLASFQGERDGDVRYIWSRTRGLSCANNLGVRAARYDIVVFTHDDVVVSPTWFRTLVRALIAVGPRGVVSGQVQPSAPETSDGFAPTLKVDQMPARYQGRVGKDVLYPLNMAMYRDTLNQVGGFDERLGPGTQFPAAEDNDLGFRLLEAGSIIHYVPDAVLDHLAWRTLRDYLPLRWGYGFAQGAFYAKHWRWRDRYIVRRMTFDVTRHLMRLPERVRRCELRPALGEVLYDVALLAGAARWWLKDGRGK